MTESITEFRARARAWLETNVPSEAPPEDGPASRDFVLSWQRKQADWEAEEQRITTRLVGLKEPSTDTTLADVRRVLELAQRAHSLYVTQKPTEQAELLKTLLLNCAIDGVSLYPTYRKPFDLIVKRAKNEEWSGREDLNLRPPGPEPGALPG